MVVFVEEENRENKDGGGEDDDDDVVVNENAKTKEKKKENRDVFVRNLPHTTTDEALENAFSEIGLVRQAWVAREKGTNVHRGFGYVSFSMKEDVEEALKHNMKLEIEGRKIGILRSKEKEKVDFKERKRLRREMKKKQEEEEEEQKEKGDDEKEKEEEKEDEQPTKEEQKQKRIRQSKGASASTATQTTPRTLEEKKTVVIAGLKIGGEIKGVDAAKVKHCFRTDKQLKKNVSEDSMKVLVERLEQACKDKSADDQTCKRYKIREDGATRGVVLLKLEREEDVQAVVERLHKFKFEETKKDKQQKKVNFEKRAKGERDADANVDDDVLWCRALVGEGANPKKHRVILRNLAFHATEKQIRDSIAKHVSENAFVWDVSIPIDQKTKKVRGFAFVAFITAKDAVNCVEKLNGQKIAGRVVAVDLALSKRQEKQTNRVALFARKLLTVRKASLFVISGTRLPRRSASIDAATWKLRLLPKK